MVDALRPVGRPARPVNLDVVDLAPLAQPKVQRPGRLRQVAAHGTNLTGPAPPAPRAAAPPPQSHPDCSPAGPPARPLVGPRSAERRWSSFGESGCGSSRRGR